MHTDFKLNKILFLSIQLHNWREAEPLTFFEIKLRQRELCSLQNETTIAVV